MISEPSANTKLLSAAIADCQNDLDEIQYLVKDSTDRLNKFIHDIQKTKQHIAPKTFYDVSTRTHEYIKRCDDNLREITETRKAIRANFPSRKLL